MRPGAAILDIDIQADQLGRADAALDPKRARKAIVAALNQTARTTRTLAARELQKAAGFKVGEAKRQMRIYKATADRPQAHLVAEGWPMLLLKAGRNARQTRKGVSITAYGRRQTYAGTFLATMPSGHRGIYTRKRNTRLPIRELYGPSVPRTLLRHDVQSAVMDGVAETLPKAMTRQIDRQQRMAAGRHKF